MTVSRFRRSSGRIPGGSVGTLLEDRSQVLPR